MECKNEHFRHILLFYFRKAKNAARAAKNLFWKKKFSWKKFETQKKNFINKFYFCPNLFSYRFERNFKKWCDSSKSWFIFSGKRFCTTWFFPIFEIELIIIKYSNLFIKILFWKIVFLSFQPLKNSFSKIGNNQVVENLFPKKMNRDLLESHHF